MLGFTLLVTLFGAVSEAFASAAACNATCQSKMEKDYINNVRVRFFSLFQRIFDRKFLLNFKKTNIFLLNNVKQTFLVSDWAVLRVGEGTVFLGGGSLISDLYCLLLLFHLFYSFCPLLYFDFKLNKFEILETGLAFTAV